VEKGIANSALQPKSPVFVRTVHDASQFLLKPPSDEPIADETLPPPEPSFVTWPSYSSPAGFVPKTKPFCRSR
jgi:hypothetical protein